MLEHRHVVTLNRDVVEKFYPLLADIILEVALLACAAMRCAPPADRHHTARRRSCVTVTTRLRRGCVAYPSPTPTHTPPHECVPLLTAQPVN